MTTEERIDALERELSNANRRNRWLLTVMVLAVIGLGALCAFTQGTPAAQAQAAADSPKPRAVSLAATGGSINPRFWVLWDNGKVTSQRGSDVPEPAGSSKD